MNTDPQSKLQSLLAQAEQLKRELEALQPMKPEDEARLWKKLRLEWNYNSNHIEGNTLTYSETELLLIYDKSTGDHDMRELEEMKAHDVAVGMIREWAKEGERPLTERDICDLNQVILVRPYWKEAMTIDGQSTRRQIDVGTYKRHPNSVRLSNGEMFNYASPTETPRMMGELIQWFREQHGVNPIALASEFHHRFILIHPFDDGNGRVARLVVNMILMQYGYQPTVIKTADKLKYIGALQRADAGDLSAFVAYLSEQAIRSLELAIRAARGEDIEEKDDAEKRFELLKRRLKGVDTERTIQKQFDKGVYLEIIQSWAIKMFDGVISSLHQFDELFTKVRYDINLGRKFGNEINENFQSAMTDLIVQIQLDSTRIAAHEAESRLSVSFSNFKAGGIETFGIHQGFTIKFEDTKYEVNIRDFSSTKGHKEVILFRRLLHQDLTDEEIEVVRSRVFKAIVEELEHEVSVRGIK
jgi:Fic family protein